MEKLFTRKEAAKLLGISITTLDAARNSAEKIKKLIDKLVSLQV